VADDDLHRKGLILGAAVGDALGAPFEFGPGGEYSRRFPPVDQSGKDEMIGGGPLGWAPGEFTDDTQMAMVLAESLLTRRSFDPDDLWIRWRAWASTAADVGIMTRSALRVTDWRDVRHPDPERTAANGALMRAFPLALPRGEDDAIREVVLRQAALTHPHPAAGWGAWLGIAAMRAALAGDDPLEALVEPLDALPVEVASRFREMLLPEWTPNRGGPGNGSVWGCLAQAIWAIRGASSFEDAVVRAIDLGGDTDTVACVTGAIAGARHGADAIPRRWLRRLHGTVGTSRGPIRYEAHDLVRIALEVSQLSPVAR